MKGENPLRRGALVPWPRKDPYARRQPEPLVRHEVDDDPVHDGPYEVAPLRHADRGAPLRKRRRACPSDDDDTEGEDPEPHAILRAPRVPSPPRSPRSPPRCRDGTRALYVSSSSCTRRVREAGDAKMERYASGQVPGRSPAEVRYNQSLFELVCKCQDRNILNATSLVSQLEASTRSLVDKAWRDCREANDTLRSSLK